MNPLNDPDIRLARQERQQDRQVERAAAAAGDSPKTFAAKHDLPYTEEYRSAPSVPGDAMAKIVVVYVSLWAIAGATLVLRWIDSLLPIAMPPWVGPAVTIVTWPITVLGAAFAMQQLRQKMPDMYALAVFVATGAIAWFIAGDALPQQLSANQVIAMVGAALSAVDAFSVLEKARAPKQR